MVHWSIRIIDCPLTFLHRRTMSRTFAIGDIHGCDAAFESLLAMITPAPDDTLIILGDVIDRGPNSARVLDMLLHLEANSNVVFVLGNHEEMMFDALEAGIPGSMWIMHGGQETLASYGGLPEHIPPTHLDFIRTKAVNFWETDTEIYVHANLDVDVPLQEQMAQQLRWQHLTGYERPHPSGKRVFCGHTPQPNGIPRITDGWVCVDTYAYGGMYITAVDVATNEIFQANQTGHTRKGVRLDDLV